MSGAVVLPDSVVDSRRAQQARLVDDVIIQSRAILGGNRVVLVSDVRWLVHAAVVMTRAERAQEAISRPADPRPKEERRVPRGRRRTRRGR